MLLGLGEAVTAPLQAPIGGILGSTKTAPGQDSGLAFGRSTHSDEVGLDSAHATTQGVILPIGQGVMEKATELGIPPQAIEALPYIIT
jgi:hypothetical protein